jgi:hypothetical protein
MPLRAIGQRETLPIEKDASIGYSTGMRMRSARKSLPLFALSLLVALFATSCAGHIGYGVMNWSIPDYSLSAGDVVPVFIQSNIGKVYVIGVGSGNRTRIEVPLWQLRLYKSRSKARQAAAAMGDYRYAYATVKLDGLPIRAEPENSARQVYRLKQDQKIKILKKGEGSPVLAGKNPLIGDWYEVMTDDGTTGWCFSYNLSLFDERETAKTVAAPQASGADPQLENLLARAWYPDSYRTMIEDSRVDLSRINPAWGFFPGGESRVARIENADGVTSFPYTSIAREADGTYRFEGSSLSAQIRRAGSLFVQYTDEAGMPHALYFASLDTTPEALIADEQARRVAVLAKVRELGPSFASGNYGVLKFPENGKFLWSGYQLLSPAVIPDGSGGGGTVEARCFLPDELAAQADGVLSFRFDGGDRWVHFIYTFSGDGLRLEQVSESNIKDSVVIARNLNPTVLFFTSEKTAADGH